MQNWQEAKILCKTNFNICVIFSNIKCGNSVQNICIETLLLILFHVRGESGAGKTENTKKVRHTLPKSLLSPKIVNAPFLKKSLAQKSSSHHFQNHYRHENHKCTISKIIILKVISYFAMVGAREGKKDSAKVTANHTIDFVCFVLWNLS